LAGRSNKETVERIDFISAVERSIAVCFSVISILSITLSIFRADAYAEICSPNYVIFHSASDCFLISMLVS
jgi:uncharacterized protein with PQ loop repeat